MKNMLDRTTHHGILLDPLAGGQIAQPGLGLFSIVPPSRSSNSSQKKRLRWRGIKKLSSSMTA